MDKSYRTAERAQLKAIRALEDAARADAEALEEQRRDKEAKESAERRAALEQRRAKLERANTRRDLQSWMKAAES